MRALTLRDPAVIGQTAGAPAFDPVNDIAWHNCHWTEGALYVASSPTNGGTVTTWHDETGNGRDLTQATSGSRPTYTATVAAFNNHPTIATDGTADFMQTASWTGLSSATIVIIGRLTGGGTIKNITDGIGSTNRQAIRGDSGGKWSITAGTALASAGNHDTSLHYFRAEYAATDTLTIDGTGVISGDAGSQTMTGLTFGSRYDGTTNYAAFEAAFIGVYSGALSTGDKALLLAWSQSHYGSP